jgi:hypothetical protein
MMVDLSHVICVEHPARLHHRCHERVLLWRLVCFRLRLVGVAPLVARCVGLAALGARCVGFAALGSRRWGLAALGSRRWGLAALGSRRWVLRDFGIDIEGVAVIVELLGASM